MEIRLKNGKRYLFLWAVFCLLVAAAGMLLPVRQLCSLGLEGANQANLRSTTEELKDGKQLEFTLELPSGQAEQIGFFFAFHKYEHLKGQLYMLALEGDRPVGEQQYDLEELTEDQFLFVPLSLDQKEEEALPVLTVQIWTDAEKEGPSLWLNETTVTPGRAILNGISLEKSLVYNLTYPVWVHQYQKPLGTGLILLLFGIGVFGAGGFSEGFGRRKQAGRDRKPILVMPDKKEVAGLGVMILAVALIFLYLYDTQIRIAQNTTEKTTVYGADGETLPVNEENQTLSQKVMPKEEYLTGLGVRFFMEEGVVLSEGSMKATVTDLTLSQVLCETKVDASAFLSGEYAGLLFQDSQEGVADHEYQIDLSFSPELWDSGLAVMTSDEGLCVNAYLYFNIFLKRFFFFIFLGVELFACLFWYVAFVKRARLENVLLLLILGFGLFYNILLSPQMVPDEEKHMDMAYRYSNELLGYEFLGDTRCLMRADDAALTFTASPSFGNYRNIYYGMFSRVQDDRMVEAEINSNIEGSIFLYLPAVLGMSLARLLGLGSVPMLLLARYLNLLVFALLARAGMKRLPFGKMTLFVMALLPVNLQQCTSFSHDAMVHGILFFYCCVCLQAIYEKEPMTGERMALLELMAWFLVFCKSGSYLPLCFLPVLIPYERFRGRRQKYVSLGALYGIPVLLFLMKHMQMVTGIVQTTEATSVVSTGGGSAYMTGYTLGYFIKEPLKLVYMIVNTILDKTGFYLESLVGYKLGWVEIETSMALVLFFWFLLFLSICDVQEEIRKISGFQRFFMLLLCAGCTGLILLGMLLQWTPMGHVSIEGVQGRYFLPFLLIFLTACKNRGTLLSRRMDRGIGAAAAAGQLLTLILVIRQVTMV